METGISTNIRTLRISKGYKQEFVALKTKMTQANYSKIESGKIEPSLQQIEKLSQIFETTTEEIMHGKKVVIFEEDNSKNELTN